MFISKVLLEHSHAHSFVYDCFPATGAELSNCDRDHLVCKANTIYSQALYRQCLPIF